MTRNGPAIKCVCVSRRQHRQDPGTLARKLSRRAPRERSEQRGCKEAMAHFLLSGYKLSKVYELRGTNIKGSQN